MGMTDPSGLGDGDDDYSYDYSGGSGGGDKGTDESTPDPGGIVIDDSNYITAYYANAMANAAVGYFDGDPNVFNELGIGNYQSLPDVVFDNDTYLTGEQLAGFNQDRNEGKFTGDPNALDLINDAAKSTGFFSNFSSQEPQGPVIGIGGPAQGVNQAVTTGLVSHNTVVRSANKTPAASIKTIASKTPSNLKSYLNTFYTSRAYQTAVKNGDRQALIRAYEAYFPGFKFDPSPRANQIVDMQFICWWDKQHRHDSLNLKGQITVLTFGVQYSVNLHALGQLKWDGKLNGYISSTEWFGASMGLIYLYRDVEKEPVEPYIGIGRVVSYSQLYDDSKKVGDGYSFGASFPPSPVGIQCPVDWWK
jgi:hypothetical protein